MVTLLLRSFTPDLNKLEANKMKSTKPGAGVSGLLPAAAKSAAAAAAAAEPAAKQQQQKHAQDSVELKDAEERLGRGFLFLAERVFSNTYLSCPLLARECALTAFSLAPSMELLALLRRCARDMEEGAEGRETSGLANRAEESKRMSELKGTTDMDSVWEGLCQDLGAWKERQERGRKRTEEEGATKQNERMYQGIVGILVRKRVNIFLRT